jgi:hypothetical protein
MVVNLIETYNELFTKNTEKVTKEGNESLVFAAGKNN